MNILLDTCTFLWIAGDDPRLSRAARDLFSDRNNAAYLSVVSGWEIAVKVVGGRLSLSRPPERFVPEERRALGIETLPLEEDAVLQTTKLPRLHADPFDRMLVCQALVHGLVILTPDELIAQYPVRVVW